MIQVVVDLLCKGRDGTDFTCDCITGFIRSGCAAHHLRRPFRLYLKANCLLLRDIAQVCLSATVECVAAKQGNHAMVHPDTHTLQ